MELIRQIAAVIGVLTLLLAALWWLRRHGFAVTALARKPDSRRMECVERLSLGPQQTLHLVRLGNTALVLASSPAGCSLIANVAYNDTAVRHAGEPAPPRPISAGANR